MKLLLAATLALTTITLMNLVTPIQEALREASQQTTELP